MIQSIPKSLSESNPQVLSKITSILALFSYIHRYKARFSMKHQIGFAGLERKHEGRPGKGPLPSPALVYLQGPIPRPLLHFLLTA